MLASVLAKMAAKSHRAPADILKERMSERSESTAIAINNVIASKIDPASLRFESNMRALADLVAQVRNEEEKIREGGGASSCSPTRAHSSSLDFMPRTACMKNGAEHRRRA